jgi:PAS domain S-box-containing protein
MAEELRKTGISIVGDVPWGTHFCNFYESKEDLLDTLLPYFKAGLESNEFCVWIISNSDLMTVEEAREALAQAVPNLDRHLAHENIEILIGPDWYLDENVFKLERVMNAWNKKLDQALARGYDGMRVSGDTLWLRENDWRDFCAYEKQLNNSITDQRMIVLCTYPVTKSGATEILDVVQTHQFAIARRRREWEVIASPEPSRAKAEIKRLNQDLQQILDRKPERPAILRYGLAVLSVIAALTTLLLMNASLQAAAHVSLFLCAVIVSTWFGGIRPGLLAIALSILGFAYILPPSHSFGVEMAHLPRLILFSLLAFLVASIIAAQQSKAESLRRAREVLKETVQELKRTNVALQAENVERSRAEEAVHQSEDHLRLVIDTIPVMAWSLRPDGVVDFLNQRWMDYAGLSLEQYVADPMGPIHPDDVPRIMEKWRAQMAIGEGYEDEMRLRRADGEYRWFLVRTEPLRDAQGNLIKWYGSSTDIEDRKQAEEKLKHKEVQLAQAQRLAHIGSWDWDLRTNVVTWSDELYHIFGLEPGTISVAGEVDRFIHPDDLELGWDTVRRAIASKEPYDYYHRILRPDGTERIARSRGSIMGDERGEPIKVFGATQDVTELKRAEENLKATSAQLRALSASLQSAREQESTRIAREIHDELGGTLTSLRWDLEEIRDLISEAATSSQLAALRSKIEVMITLTETILDTVRRLASELRPMALDELGLVEAIEWQALQFETRTGIAVEYECHLEKVDLNSEQSTVVFRILQEALTNVLRHAQATAVTITMKQESGEFFLAIKDNGRGITEKEKSDAHSLGLLGMRERAHLIGAQIDITGTAGEGTLVAVRIPINQSSEHLKV